MRYVVDSSVAFKWALPEVHSDKALQLRDDFRNGIHELVAPDIFPIEIGHALTRAERQRRIAVGKAKLLLADVMNASPLLEPALHFLGQACDLSSKLRIGIYDCLYLALAMDEQCDFVTADDKLAKKTQAAFSIVKPLTSFP